jgi:hypothetical protein
MYDTHHKLCGERPETRNFVTEKQSIREQRILLHWKALKCCKEENRSVVYMYEFYIQSFHISYKKNIFYGSTSDKISATYNNIICVSMLWVSLLFTGVCPTEYRIAHQTCINSMCYKTYHRCCKWPSTLRHLLHLVNIWLRSVFNFLSWEFR